jgi:hypothetical protein
MPFRISARFYRNSCNLNIYFRLWNYLILDHTFSFFGFILYEENRLKLFISRIIYPGFQPTFFEFL